MKGHMDRNGVSNNYYSGSDRLLAIIIKKLDKSIQSKMIKPLEKDIYKSG